MPLIRILFANSFILFLLKLTTSIVMLGASKYLFDFANGNKIEDYYLWLFLVGQIVLSAIWAVLFYLLYFIISKIELNIKMFNLVLTYIIMYFLEFFISHTREMKNFIWNKNKINLHEIFLTAFGLIISGLIFVALYQIVGKKIVKRPTSLP